MTKKGYAILVLPGWYPNRTNPTLGNFVQKHAEASNILNDVSVLYVCPDENLQSTNYEVVNETINGVLTIIVYYKKVNSAIPLLSSYKKLKYFFRAYNIGYKKLLAEKGKPDLVHLNILIKAGLFALYLQVKHGINYVYTENWTGFLPTNPLFKPNTIQHAIYKFIANRSKVLLPVTENLKSALITHGIRGRYHIVGNVVDTAIFKPSQKVKTNNKFKFVHISHAIDEHKNISGILRAIEKFKNIRTDFELLIISDGETQQHIQYATQLGVYNSHVFFEGTHTTTELANKLSAADCLVLFSNYENLPCVIPEALACGIPVISTDVGGVSEHISNQTGILVTPKNENELVMALKKMMETYNNYSSQKLRAYAVLHFSYDKVGEAFQEAYQLALTKNA